MCVCVCVCVCDEISRSPLKNDSPLKQEKPNR